MSSVLMHRKKKNHLTQFLFCKDLKRFKVDWSSVIGKYLSRQKGEKCTEFRRTARGL